MHESAENTIRDTEPPGSTSLVWNRPFSTPENGWFVVRSPEDAFEVSAVSRCTWALAAWTPPPLADLLSQPTNNSGYSSIQLTHR